MHPRISIILIILSLIVPEISLGQQPSFRNYTVDNGLPSSEIYHIIQDKKGYIWMATNMGVSRFDGRTFKNFDVQNGLPENTVFEIFEDEAERLWFVSFPFQLSYFENDSIHAYKYNNKLSEIAGHGLVPLKKCFRADKESNIWFSFLNEGSLFSIDKSGNLTKTIEISDDSPSTSIIQIGGQFLAAQSGTRSNIDFTIKLKTRYKEFIVKLDNPTRKYSGGYFIIAALKSGELLFAQNELLTIIEKDGSYISRSFDNRILWLSSDNEESVWIGKEFTGAEKYSIKALKENLGPSESYLNGITVTSILKDNEGGLWYSSQGAGLFYLPSKAFISYTIEDGLSGQNVKYLEFFQGKLYIGADDSYKMDVLENEKIHTIDDYGQDKNKIKALSNYQNQILWIGTEKHLHSFNGTTYSKIINNHPFLLRSQINTGFLFSIKDIYPLSDSKVFLAQMRSLAIVESGNVSYDSYYNDQLALRIESIAKGADNSFLLGTFNGLWTFDGRTFNYLGSNSPLLSERITDIISFNNGKSYILATKGSGLIVKSGDSLTQVNTSDGLSSNSVTSLLINETELWVATNNGVNILKLAELTKKSPKVIIFKREQGLISNEVNQIKGYENYIYIATNKGLTVFNRNKYQPLIIPPPVYIQNININKKDTVFNSTPRLEYNQNLVSISYSAVNFRDAGELQYKYRLKGLTDNWIYTRNLQVEYAFLPPGNYTFEVFAINSEGLISLVPATLKFTIKPPFWKTWLFISSIVFFVLTLIALYFRSRVKMLRKEHQLQSDIDKYREQALIRQMDPHFVFNSLNSIQSFIIKNDSAASSHYLSKFARLMRLILNNSQKQAVTVTDEVDALSLYMELESMRFKHKFEFSVNVDPSIESESTYIPAFLVQPFIENSIWHGIMSLDTTGVIKVNFAKDNEQIICSIEDNGIGRKKSAEMKTKADKYKKSLGISIVESRLHLLSNYYGVNMKIVFSDLYDENQSPLGTRVSVNMPIVINPRKAYHHTISPL